MAKQQKIDKEVFDAFFKENYCPLEYGNIKNDFEEIAACGLEELFVDDTDTTEITENNFILYLTSWAYSEFEACIEEAMDVLNPEISDALMDVSATMEHADEVTEIYWNTLENLLKEFLRRLYVDRIQKMIQEC